MQSVEFSEAWIIYNYRCKEGCKDFPGVSINTLPSSAIVYTSHYRLIGKTAHVFHVNLFKCLFALIL